MREELIERLTVALHCAELYPRALIVRNDGGTAAEDETAIEAGRMAGWLIENGVDPERMIVEDKSLTTAHNAIYAFDILEASYPRGKGAGHRLQRLPHCHWYPAFQRRGYPSVRKKVEPKHKGDLQRRLGGSLRFALDHVPGRGLDRAFR